MTSVQSRCDQRVKISLEQTVQYRKESAQSLVGLCAFFAYAMELFVLCGI